VREAASVAAHGLCESIVDGAPPSIGASSHAALSNSSGSSMQWQAPNRDGTGAATAPHRLAPAFGADTESVLREHGYDCGKIAELRERGSIK